MKIGTYNVKFLFDAGTRLHSGKECTFTTEFVEKRFEFFAKTFDELDADILFLQEVGDESAIQKILAKTTATYKYFIAEPDKYGVGNAVIYIDTVNCECSSVPTNTSMPVFSERDTDQIGPRIWSRRDYVKLVTEYKDKPLTMFGIHVKSRFLMYKEGASFPESPEHVTQIDKADAAIRSEMFRLSQTKKIRELVDEQFGQNPTAHVAVMGDFNTPPRTVLFSMATGRPDSSADTLVQAVETDSVDQVLVSKELLKHVGETKIHTDDVAVDSPESIASDHAPIIIELE